MELCSVLCDSLDGRGVWQRMGTYVCMADSFCCPLETTTTLLIGYTPKQKVKKKNFYGISFRFFRSGNGGYIVK